MDKQIFRLEQTNRWSYKVYYAHSNVSIGTFEQDVDGYFYYFFPDTPRSGFIPYYYLRVLADLLEELNEPWDKICEQMCDGGKHIPEVSF